VKNGFPREAGSDAAEDIARDVATIAQIQAVPTLLRVLCETTGMGFAAVARVTDGTWTACAVRDNINFGLKAGGQLDVNTTLCIEVRASRKPIVIDHASIHPEYCTHHTPQHYGIESYISVPIVLPEGVYFGNLCAIDPRPAKISEDRIVSMFTLFAELIALELDNERKRALSESALLNERTASELREQFIAILGHDLRNPLNAIAACGYLLQKSSADHALANIATRIITNVKRMSGLIDDVLDFARARLGGGIALQMEEVFDMDRALAAIVSELKDAQPGRVIDSKIDHGFQIQCDRGRIQQLASNLLANALTHGSKGAPVKFTAEVCGPDLVIEVCNDGEPIPADSIEKIFAPFWRSGTAENRQGLGLGLHICSQIVKAHHGTLAVQSSREHGTKFTATLPLAAAQSAVSLLKQSVSGATSAPAPHHKRRN
jgi:signal transduction histidine kinase